MIWIDNQPDLDAAMQRVAAQKTIAVDTEADSLHSYFDKVCLIQISIDDEDLVIDPLSKLDLKGFGAVLADPSILKVLHGADYDLRILNRDFGFTISNLIDTSVAAQLLGYEAFGLAALLDRHFGLKLNKAHQRADWSMRPLPPDMLDYAATDTRHLVALATKLREELEALGRWEWAVEEFARLEAIRFVDRDDDGERFRRLKGIGGFDRRSLAVLRALHEWRDALARKADRPPFKIIGNDAIVDIAREKPTTRDELGKIKSVAQFHRNKYGAELLRLVAGALALPEDQLPERGESKAWIRDKSLEARIDKMKKVRDAVAKELKIDPSILAARHILSAIAAVEPSSVDDLDQVPAMREWQKKVAGEKLLAALGPRSSAPPAPVNGRLF